MGWPKAMQIQWIQTQINLALRNDANLTKLWYGLLCLVLPKRSLLEVMPFECDCQPKTSHPGSAIGKALQGFV